MRRRQRAQWRTLFLSFGPAEVPSSAALVLALCACAAGAVEADSEVTRRILDAVDRAAGNLTLADKRAADQLNAEGDAAYRKGDYLRARRAYWNSYPNYPSAHAYILAGDAYRREALQHAQQQTPKGARQPSGCALDNEHFAAELALDVERRQAVGLALASRENRGSLPDTAFFRRVTDEVSCLRLLAQRYRGQLRSVCVDLSALQDCLGPPLLGSENGAR